MNLKTSVVIPVYNEGALIVSTIKNITSSLKNNFEFLICYDFDEDDTLFEIKQKFSNQFVKSKIRFIKNCGYGPHGAVMSGINKSIGNFVIVIPADDSINSKKLINLVDRNPQILKLRPDNRLLYLNKTSDNNKKIVDIVNFLKILKKINYEK